MMRARLMMVALGALTAGAALLAGNAGAVSTEACSPTPEVPSSFCVTADLSLSTQVAGRAVGIDADAVNTSPGAADTNKADWLETITLRLAPTGVPVPELTPSADLPNGLLLAGEPSPTVACTETNNFADCEAGHGMIKAELTDSSGFDGFYDGIFGITRISNVFNIADPIGTTRWAIALRGCIDTGTFGLQCTNTEIQVVIPRPPAGQPLEIPIDSRIQAPAPIVGGTADTTLRSLEGFHVDQRSATLSNGTPADQGYIIARLPSECGTLDGSARFLSGDARTVSIPRPFEITGCTTTTVKARTPRTKVRVKGAVDPPVDEGTVEVTLQAKRNGTFQDVKVKDIITDAAGKYRGDFGQPKARKCRAIAEFVGDLTHASSEATSPVFSCA